jgi:hypothetical protein
MVIGDPGGRSPASFCSAVLVHSYHHHPETGSSTLSGLLPTSASMPDDTIHPSSDVKPVIRRLRSLLARVSSGEVVASRGFEQRQFGAQVALEVVASGDAINVRTLVERLA